ncbi:MAG: hypothetical protein HUU60_08720 [Armatimonadetes bacterium]|nr:hypothetical protein [Armatimonadota bacterium]
MKKPDGNDANNGLSWANAKAAIGSALAASSSGDSVWVAGDDTTPYLEQIEIPDGVKAYGGFEGIETSINDRNFAENDTTLDADGEDYAVTFDETSGTTTRRPSILPSFNPGLSTRRAASY